MAFTEIQKSEDKGIDIKKVLYRSIKYWYIILLSFLFSGVIAFFIYKSTKPLYQVSSNLLISGNQNQSAIVGAQDGSLPGINLGVVNNIENQLIILTSSRQIEKTLSKLDFMVSYYEDGFFIQNEIYTNSPFIVKLETKINEISSQKYNLKFKGEKRFVLTKKEDDTFSKEYNFFEKINLDGNTFTILPNEETIENSNYQIRDFIFEINSLPKLVHYFQRNIRIENLQTGSSIYQISLLSNNIEKGKDFIDELANASVLYTLEKKNQIAHNTIKFIDNQLIGVGDSLSVAKSVLENFRSRNEMMDISMQGQLIIDKTQDLQNEKNVLQSQLDYLNYLVDYIEDNQDVMNLLPPSAYGVDNVMISQMITELGTLNAEKEGLQFSSKIENPNVTRMSRRIESLKLSIQKQAKSNIATTNNAINDVDARLMKLSGEIRRLPMTEQKLLDIERKFQSTDRMYSYLMERRSEALLAKAANTPDNEVVEFSKVVGKVKPDSTRFIIIVILFGIFFPAVIIILIVFNNHKIQDKEDVEAITGLPIIGVIPKVQKAGNIINNVVNSRSALSESIRTIRTALDFYTSKDKCKTILVTSGLPGEGKSLTAIHIAASYAQLGKKTLLIDFDMRRPTVCKLLNVKSSTIGLSRHLVNNSGSNDKNLIVGTEIKNLEVIPAGEVPPNPADLIAGNQAGILFHELRRLYDIVVIDSPPIGLVTDAALLHPYSDITLLVIRHNVTPKKMLENLLKEKKLEKASNLCLLLNDLPITKRGYNSYSYSGKYYE